MRYDSVLKNTLSLYIRKKIGDITNPYGILFLPNI